MHTRFDEYMSVLSVNTYQRLPDTYDIRSGSELYAAAVMSREIRDHAGHRAKIGVTITNDERLRNSYNRVRCLESCAINANRPYEMMIPNG